MIKAVEINNFRCYERLELSGLGQINVIVGENGSGKTALLEAIFFPLATGTEIGMRLRSQRGIDGVLGGNPRRIEEAIWGDYFFKNDMSRSINLRLKGTGVDNRSLEISRNKDSGALLPLGDTLSGQAAPISSPVVFTWTDNRGKQHEAIPKISVAGITFPDTGEDMPDFYLFPSNQVVGSTETATRFSELSIAGLHKPFVKAFIKEYPWISDLGVEVHGGTPVLFATMKDGGYKIPVSNASSGINRLISYILAMSLRSHAIVLVDEIEVGVYYRQFPSIWRLILDVATKNHIQMFVSTHSLECLEGLIEAAGSRVADIALLRTSRKGSKFQVKRFSGEEFVFGIKYGADVR